MLLYGDVELREREQKIIEDFLAWVEKNNLTIPYGMTDTVNRQHLRCLITTPRKTFAEVYEMLITIDRF